MLVYRWDSFSHIESWWGQIWSLKQWQLFNQLTWLTAQEYFSMKKYPLWICLLSNPRPFLWKSNSLLLDSAVPQFQHLLRIWECAAWPDNHTTEISISILLYVHAFFQIRVCLGHNSRLTKFFHFLCCYKDACPPRTIRSWPVSCFTGHSKQTEHAYNLCWRLRVVCWCHHWFCLCGLLLLAWVIRWTRLIIIRAILGSFLAQKFVLTFHHALKCLIIHCSYTMLQRNGII